LITIELCPQKNLLSGIITKTLLLAVGNVIFSRNQLDTPRSLLTSPVAVATLGLLQKEEFTVRVCS
jgi:hypothetical protein